MTLVLIEVPNEEAIAALRQQKDVRVVGVVSEPKATDAPAIAVASPVRKPSVASLIGSLSPEAGERMLKGVTEMRERES